MKKILILLIIIVQCVISHAQENNDIITDRPYQTKSSWTIPKHRVQIESGFRFQTTQLDNATLDEMIYQETLLRYGLLDNFELRVEMAYSNIEYKATVTSGDSVVSATGFEPLEIGFKILIVEENGWIPRMSFVGSLVIPGVASAEMETIHYAPGFQFTGEYTFTDWMSFGFNVGTIWDSMEPDAIGTVSGILGFSVLPWFGAFAEYYAFLPGGGRENDHRLDGGFAFPVRHNLQFDVSGGIGLSSTSPDYFIAAGFAWRIPK